MTTTLKRAARAAYNVVIGEHDDVTRSPEDTDLWEHIARAVLMAVREPDDAMQNVGVDAATGTFEGWVDEGQVSTLFTAMIGAILGEG